MENLSPSLRFNLRLACSLIAAVSGILISNFWLHLNPIWLGIIGFLLGKSLGDLLFHEPEKKTPPKHINFPRELRDSYYTDLVMKRIMEIYQPQQTETQEEDEGSEDDDTEESSGLDLETADSDYGEIGEETTLSLWEVITYPTQIPTTLSILWPVIFIGMGWLFFSQDIGAQDSLFSILPFIFFPSFLLIGLSGILVLAQKSTATIFGRLVEGPESYIDGIAKIFLGLTGCIYSSFIL